MTLHTKSTSSSTLSGSSDTKFVLPKRGYGVTGLDSLVPGNLLAFGFFFVVYSLMTAAVAASTFMNSAGQNDLKLYAVAAVGFVGAGLCGLRTFSLYHKWQSAKFDVSVKVEIARNEYIKNVLIPWCEGFNVALSQDEASALLNGDVVPASINGSEGCVALVKSGVKHKLVEVSDVDDFLDDVPQLETKHYDSGEVKILKNVEADVLRVRVDSFASYFGVDANLEGFADMSEAPGFGFIRNK